MVPILMFKKFEPLGGGSGPAVVFDIPHPGVNGALSVSCGLLYLLADQVRPDLRNTNSRILTRERQEDYKLVSALNVYKWTYFIK